MKEPWKIGLCGPLLAAMLGLLAACPPPIRPCPGGGSCQPDSAASWDPGPPPQVFVVSMSQCPNGSGGAFCDVRVADGAAPPAGSCQYSDKGYCDTTIVGRCKFQWLPEGSPCNAGLGTCQQHQCVRRP